MRYAFIRFLQLSVVLAALASQAAGQCTSVFYDGFESGVLGPAWSLGTGSYTRTITSTAPGVGTYSFQHAATTSNSFYQGTYALFTPSQPTYISYWMKTDVTTGANGYFVIGDANINSDNGILFCYFNSTSGLRFFNSAGVNYPITSNTWYHVEIMDINWTARNMDIYINGVLFLTDWAFRSGTATSVDRVHLFSLVPSVPVYDDIMIGRAGPSIDSVSWVSPNCYGDSTGLIDLVTTPGTGTSHFLWSTGDTLEDLSGLSAGTYTVTVTDGIGCMAYDTVTISEPSALLVLDSLIDVTCFGDTTGSIDLSVSGGTPGYTYLWSGGSTATTEDLTGIGAGYYSVLVTDTAGCTSSLDSLWVSEPPALSLTDSLVFALCHGDTAGEIHLSAFGGTPGYTYTWSTGDSSSSLMDLLPGSYSVTVTDSFTCSITDSFTIVEPAALGLSFMVISIDSGFSEGAIDLSVVGGTPPYSYVWSNGDTVQDPTTLTVGYYWVTVTDSLGCTTTDSVFIDFWETVEGAANQLGMNLWPNPFAGDFTLQLQGGFGSASVQLLDLQGRVLWQAEMPAQGQQTFSPLLAAGVYVLRVTTAEGVGIRKVIKVE
jgi:hypothetical protein